MSHKLSEKEKTDLLARIQAFSAELDRIKPPHGKAERDRLRQEGEDFLARVAELGELDPVWEGHKRDTEIVLWALRLAEEQLPPGMAKQ